MLPFPVGKWNYGINCYTISEKGFYTERPSRGLPVNGKLEQDTSPWRWSADLADGKSIIFNLRAAHRMQWGREVKHLAGETDSERVAFQVMRALQKPKARWHVDDAGVLGIPRLG